MGTFHQHKGDLHGITVVVETDGPELYVGRCDEVTEANVVLLDVDVHRDGEDSRTREQYLRDAVRCGTWKKHDFLAVPRARVTSIRKLGEVTVP
jgi:hypothetical protein